MSTPTEQPVWRALTVKSRHEKVASQHLRLRGLDEFLPLHSVRRAWSDRSKIIELPLFPGYVFCRLGQADRFTALSAPGVTSIVGFGIVDCPVEDSEITNIRRILASGLPVEPWPYLRSGDAVRIQAGPLTGLQGTVVREKGLSRLVVNVDLLRRSVAVEMGREMVQATRRPAEPYATRLAMSA